MASGRWSERDVELFAVDDGPQPQRGRLKAIQCVMSVRDMSAGPRNLRQCRNSHVNVSPLRFSEFREPINMRIRLLGLNATR